MAISLRLCIIGCLLALVDYAHAAEPNPLKGILGTHAETGHLFQGDKKIPLRTTASCRPLGDGTAVICTGQTGKHFAWLDVFEWNPKTGWITKTSHSTSPDERLTEVSGPWDAKTKTWTLTGLGHHLTGPQTHLRTTREFLVNGQIRFRLYVRSNGKELLVVETLTAIQ